MTVPVPRREGHCLLGFDDEGELVAIALWVLDASGQHQPAAKIRLIAVSVDVRGQGGDVARLCLQEVCARIVEAIEPGKEVLVYGLVHRENSPSQRMLSDFDFSLLDEFESQEPDLQMWAIRLTATQ